jgi:hypothetical protein
MPQPDGTLATVPFRPSSTADFNIAVGQFKSQVAQANAGEITRQHAQQQPQHDAKLAAWQALPVCQHDDAAQVAENEWYFYQDCHWPDGRTQICNPYYAAVTDDHPSAPACPYPSRGPDDKPPS